MKFEHTEVFNFEGAIRGMRNPLNSWAKSDSGWDENHQVYTLGENDLGLAQRLIRGGSEHRKFLRQISISVDITAPLYFWKEFDTYKVGTTANSTSTMHKLKDTSITIDCFEIGDYEKIIYDNDDKTKVYEAIEKDLLPFLEHLRLKYKETNDKKYWKELVRWLPNGWLQTRTVTLNYENIYSMIRQRSTHKLTEWSKDFMAWAESLPYANELLFLDLT